MCWWLLMTCTHWHSGEFTPHHLCWLFDRYSHILYRKLVFFLCYFVLSFFSAISSHKLRIDMQERAAVA